MLVVKGRARLNFRTEYANYVFSVAAESKEHAIAGRKFRRSVPDVPGGPLSDALLTDVSSQLNVGNGRPAAQAPATLNVRCSMRYEPFGDEGSACRECLLMAVNENPGSQSPNSPAIVCDRLSVLR